MVRAPGPSLDPTLFPPEPRQDQINDQFTYPPQTTMGLPGNVMTDEQQRAWEEFRHTGRGFDCPLCDEEPPPEPGQMPGIEWVP